MTESKNDMSRRRFLKWSGGLLTASLVGGFTSSVNGQSNKLLIYSDTEAKNMQTCMKGFRTDTGLSPKILRLSTTPARRRIVEEMENPVSDLWWGARAPGAVKAAKAGALRSIETENTKKLPPEYKSDDNTWFGTSFWADLIAINTNSFEELGLDRPKSYLDLADPQYRGEISCASPLQSGGAMLYVLSWVQLYGEEKAFEFMKKLDKNVATYTESTTTCARHAARGRTAIGLAWDEITLRLKNKGFPVDWVNIKEGYPASLDVVAAIKNAPHPQNARIALNWALSKQAIINKSATRTGITRPDIPAEKLHTPEYLIPYLKKVNRLNYNVKLEVERAKEVLGRWEKLFG